MTTSQIPESIINYFRAAEAADIDALVACFTDDAKVTDEGVTRRGHAAIRRWREEVAAKYEYTLEVLSSRGAEDGRCVVTTKLEGNFPGGTAQLDYRFTPRDGLIRALEIVA